MEITKKLEQINLDDNIANFNYEYINTFKNPLKLPINQIHLERSFKVLKRNIIPKDIDISSLSSKEVQQYFETKTEIIPALDPKWLPKGKLFKYEPYSMTSSSDENITFITKNTLFIDSLDYLLKCGYHQFWCTILFDPSAAVILRSFLLNPLVPQAVDHLEDEYQEIYNGIYYKVLLVYEKLFAFNKSETEFMPTEYGFQQLINTKLINLPILLTLAYLYKDTHLEFVNKVTNMYFNNISQLEFQIREVEEMIGQSLIVLEMIGGHVCGFENAAVIVPISIEKRPAVFCLSWIHSVVCYLLNTMSTLNVLFQFYKPAIEIALRKNLPYRLPFIYVNIYRELYELLGDRDELHSQKQLSSLVFDLINYGRSEFVDVFHIFVSSCLDEALKHMGDTKKQEDVTETYLKLLTTALEDDYFICDYNMKYNVGNQNEMFESCTSVDSTRTTYIVSCINKLPRDKRICQASKLHRHTIESIFKELQPPVIEHVAQTFEPQPGPSRDMCEPDEDEIDQKIRVIMDMLPHLGDGFIYQCLLEYNFITDDVINAILEEKLPPHLYDTPMDAIRIPPEPEPEQPVLAYQGKKPTYDNAMSMLNDKKVKSEMKTLVLEGIQYNYDQMYDDEYDDRFDDDIPVNVTDNPVTEEAATFNPNHQNVYELASDGSNTSDDEDEQRYPSSSKQYGARGKLPFCEDPAVLRERQAAKFRGQRGGASASGPSRPPSNVVGKPKGQGQDKNVLLNRQKKNTNKSTRANHNRKGGAQFKRNKGMIPS